MSAFRAALWAEGLKARRSRLGWAVSAAILLLPAVDGLFMGILKNPEQARAMGLITLKARLLVGSADWQTFLQFLLQGTAAAGAMLFAFITTWVFGREFSDHTVKELLAIPTRRETIVASKLVLAAVWAMVLALVMFLVGLGIGKAADIPGWTQALFQDTLTGFLLATTLTIMLMPLVALVASASRGYLAPLGWALGTMVLAQLSAVLGWAEYFPWAVPALATGALGPRVEQVGLHSYVAVLLACLVGIVGTLLWWRSADQSR
jgi:ABC-2 type transport system permease protein